VLEIALAGWGVQAGAILLYNEPEAAWHRWTQRGLADGPNHPHFELAVELAEEARRSGQSKLIPDLSQHSIRSNGLRSVAIAPLYEAGKLLGVLLMATPQPNFFQPRQAPFFAAIAHQAALAISNAQLHTQMQQMAILEERYRLSREIHDGLAQTLSSLGWHLDYLKTLLDKEELDTLQAELESGRQMVREAYLDVREAIDGLRVQSDHPGDLPAALQECLAEFEQRSGIETTLEIDHSPVDLPAETELQLLRIMQEALGNIRKHAQASQVWVRLQHPPTTGRLSLSIADNGVGFDPALPRGRGHLGMSTMRERAQSQQGELTIVTGPEQGTRITVTLPLRKETKESIS
jgi:two-component system nitrate/nitrite sensor histidine kinase NarX